MNILLVDNGTSYLPALQSLIPPADITVTPFEKLTEHNFDRYDLVILSGGHKYAIMSHRRKYSRELKLIAASNRPLIGICLGFELVVVAFGGSLRLLRRRVHRNVTITFTHDDPLSGSRPAYRVFESHRRGVKRLPDALIPLARSTNGVEIVKHSNRPIYAFQFHPEMSEPGEGEALIRNAIRLLGQGR